MGSWGDRKRYGDVTVNLGLYYLLEAGNKMLARPRFGGENGDATAYQGSWSGAAASAGTHTGMDAVDLSPYNWRNREHVFRLLGLALWHRPTISGVWVEHMHGITDGGGASDSGQRQVSSYHDRRNGLRDNGPDLGYRMAVFPKFVFPEKAVGKPGVCYTKVDTAAYEQQHTSTKVLEHLDKGQKFTVVAVTRVGTTYWGVNPDGKCVPMSRLSRTPVDTDPEPEPTTLTFHAGTINVIRWRLGPTNTRGVADFKKGLPYTPDRVAGFNEMQDEMGVSIVTTTESGTYADGTHLSAALGFGGLRYTVGNPGNFVLHGDDAGDITSAVHWHPKRVALAEGKIKTGGAVETANHCWATWVLLKDVRTGLLHYQVSHHAYYKAAGTTSASSADKIREKNTASLISQMAKVQAAGQTKYGKKHIPILYSGDWNQDRNDFYDGPGRAMKAAGYVDAETLATSASGPETTYNGLDPDKVEGRALDRWFIDPDWVRVGAMKTVPGYPNTDHNGRGFAFTIRNA